jgi:dipeptidyl-peptidase-3
MILCYGQDLITRILTPIHIWRCTGDFEQAKAFTEKYSAVNDHFLKIRKIIIDVNIPRRLELYHNLEIGTDSNINIKQYSDSLEGIINSYVDRYFIF